MKLYDYTYEQIQALLLSWNEPAFRAKQIFAWCAKGAPVEQMHNIPKALRQKLASLGLGGMRIEQTHRSADGTKKFLFRCEDGNAVEGVLMKNHHGGTLCISTQAGCRMGCAFCASTQLGLARNLTIGELCGQLYAVRRQEGEDSFTHVVLMGCGEPLDNYENVVAFLRIVSDDRGMGLSLRHVSLSTCGLVPQIDRLAEEQLPITLCLSLHAPNDEIRRSIMPISKRYSIEETIAAMKRYEEKTSRRVAFEYTLINGVNDGLSHAKELAYLTKGIRKHINLIPLNQGVGAFQPPSRAKVQAFLKVLTDLGCFCHCVRRRQGDDVAGARLARSFGCKDNERSRHMIEYFAQSHVGLVRKGNEDSYYAPSQSRPKDPQFFLCVADGLGGHNAGEIASQLAVRTMVTSMQTMEGKNQMLDHPFETMQRLFFEANDKIHMLSTAK